MGEDRHRERSREHFDPGAVRSLERQVSGLKREVRDLRRELKGEEGSGVAYLTSLIGKPVYVQAVGEEVCRKGTLEWFDKFTIGLRLRGSKELICFFKGKLISVAPSGDA